MELDQRPAVWVASNIKHIERDHPERGIERGDVDDVLADPRRLEYVNDRTGVEYHTVIGITRRGRVLAVVWVDHPDGRFPVHARPAGRPAAREYYR